MAARLASAVALALAVASQTASAAGRPQVAATAACTAEDASACADAGAQGGSRTVSLVQVHRETERVQTELQRRALAGRAASGSGAAAAAEISAHIRNFLAAPANVGAALAAGVMAIQSSLPLFTAERPQLARGLTILGTKLFDAVSMIIPEETKQSQEFEDFEQVWGEMVQALPGTVEGLATGIQAFREEGDSSALVRVCNTVIKELAALVTRVLPQEVGAEVAKYIGALEDAVGGFDDAMEAFAAGNTTGAVAAVYSGIRLAAMGLLPEEAQRDESYAAVVGVLDTVFQDLSKTVLMYRQHLLQSKVCWKASTAREHRRPDQCPDHMRYDGRRWCTSSPGGRDGSPSLLDASVAWKRPSGSVAPRCAEDGDFSELRGSWCYKDCPYGLEASGSRCKSLCTGAYPIDSALMCGQSPGTVRAALLEMTIRTVRGFLTAKALIDESGPAGALDGTITTLVDVGAGFAHPQCPAPSR